MSLDDIEVFVEVVEAGSFTKGAKRLGIPLSTASAKVARLEETLGATLLQRTTRQVQVTEDGQLYYGHCIQALAALSAGREQLGAARATPLGTLRISAPADLAQFVLADAVEAYLARWPEVSVELIVTNRKVNLIAEAIDLALRVGPLEDSSLIARKFIEAEIGLYTSRDYIARNGLPETLEGMDRHSVIRMSLGRDMAQKMEGVLSPSLLAAEWRIAADDFSTIRTMVARGMGIGLLPSFTVEGQPDAAQFQRVLPDTTAVPTAAYLIYPPQRFLAPKLRAFLDMAMP